MIDAHWDMVVFFYFLILLRFHSLFCIYIDFDSCFNSQQSTMIILFQIMHVLSGIPLLMIVGHLMIYTVLTEETCVSQSLSSSRSAQVQFPVDLGRHQIHAV